MVKRQQRTDDGHGLTATGTYTLDQALDAGLFRNAVGYRSSGRPRNWYLTYEDGSVGRAVIVGCWGFELLTLGLSHRRRYDVSADRELGSSTFQLNIRPPRWRDAS